MSEQSKKNGTILIVDDEVSVRLAFEAAFLAEGFSVTTASDGGEALAILERDSYDKTYDVMVLDIRMPGVDGLEVMERLHSMDRVIPTILTSAYTDTGTAVRAAYFGVVDYLKKPCTPVELRKAVFEMMIDTERFSNLGEFKERKADDVLRWMKWNYRQGNIETALKAFNLGKNEGKHRGLGVWKLIGEHLKAITDQGKKKPEFASDNFYDAADLLDQIALNSDIQSAVGSCIDLCNKALRREHVIIGAYDHVLTRFANEDLVGDLQNFRNDHLKSVEDLAKAISEMGGVPAKITPTDIPISPALREKENLFGENSAINYLVQNEENLLREYELEMECSTIQENCVTIYATLLIPRVQSHLNNIMKLHSLALSED